MRASTKALVVALAISCFTCCSDNEPVQIINKVTPPEITREFRGVWIPTVANLCWPSKRGLSTADQKAELVALLDRAVDLNLNAVIFQVRPACDALYQSDIEPWSEYLTGTQGQAPSPYYDPLEFAVDEAHKRGLELHAWFNPFRVRTTQSKAPISESHISKLRPDLVRSYGNLLWLDPGEPEAQDHTIRVVLDVVKRYDIDAVHFDDYFYPYPEKNVFGKDLDFPDKSSWKQHGESTELSRDDWRRRNVDQFVQRVYQEVHDAKSHVKFGISPFGIWRPKNPPTIEGLDAYGALFADARKWLQEGWCDYMAPQLYWPIDHPPTSFSVLLKWWSNENVKKRHLFPGLNTLKTSDGWPVSEIERQIQLIREQDGVEGEIHWSASAFMKSPALESELKNNAYSQPALVPKFSWLDDTPPEAPTATASVQEDGNIIVHWSVAGPEQPWQWVIQSMEPDHWKTRILPGAQTSIHFDSNPSFIAITAVDRSGNTSPSVVLKIAE